MTFVITRIQTRDFDRWKPMFDQDRPRGREDAKEWRVFRNADDPNEVFILIEFDSADGARTARERLVSSGVLDRFDDTAGPTVIEVVDVYHRSNE